LIERGLQPQCSAIETTNRRKVVQMAKVNNISRDEFERLPDSAKVRIGTMATMFAVSKETIRRRVKAGVMPAPHKVGGTVCWSVAELRQALAARV
jgi:predicted DNA-binding transcriptional regulator AlpA